MQVSDAQRTRGPVRRPQLSEARPDDEAEVMEQLERAGVGRGSSSPSCLLTQQRALSPCTCQTAASTPTSRHGKDLVLGMGGVRVML